VAAVLGTVLFTFSVPAGTGTALQPSVATPSLRHARQCASVRRSTSGTIVVPVVVDTGGSSDAAEVSCVSVPSGSNGAQVLAARAQLLGEPAPRYAESGLLCAIDGYPATGCGQASGTHYAYWAYYHGGSSWTYASVGPASWPVSAGDVEGWRFQPEGSATPADPPPRAPSAAATLCPVSAPPTTTTTTPSSPPPTTPPATSPGPAPAGGHGGSGSSQPSTGAGGARPPVVTGSSDQRTTSTTQPAVAPTTSVVPPSTAGGSTGGGTSGGGASPGLSGTGSFRRQSAARDVHGHGAVPVGLIAAIAVITLLAAAAFVRSRRLTKAP
jgi:hypothetical protein